MLGKPFVSVLAIAFEWVPFLKKIICLNLVKNMLKVARINSVSLPILIRTIN